MADIPEPEPAAPDSSADSRPKLTWRSLVVVLIAVNALFGAYRVQTRQDSHFDDGVQHLISAYARVVRSVPAEDRLALLSYDPDAAATARLQLIAQHGLAPRIVRSDQSDATYLVTTPNAPEDAGADARVAGYQLVARFDAGIRLYRRAP